MTSLGAGRAHGLLSQIAYALVLAIVVAVTFWWGFVREHAPMAPRGIRVEANFTVMPNGPAPDHFDGGHPATVIASSGAPGDQLRIRAGALTYQPTTQGTAAAFFTSPDLGSSVTGMGARFVFRPGSGSSGAIAFVVSRGIDDRVPPTIGPIPIQLVVTPINWNISISRTNNAPLEVVAAGDFEHPLREDGETRYEARLRVHDDRVTLDLPGTHKVVSDPRFSEWQGSFATFELFSNNGATDSIGAFDTIWATGEKD